MSDNTRVGVILAAGLGSRLRENLGTSPSKLLLEIEGEPLLMRTIRSHEKADIAKIVIITGWRSDLIRREVQKRYAGPAELCFEFNEQYELSNGISLLKAKPHIKTDFLLTMADHVLDDGIMKDSINQVPPEDGAILFVDYKIESVFDLQDATKVMAKAGLVHRIGKDIEDYNCVDTGVFIGTGALLQEIDEKYVRDGDASLTDGVQALASRGKMRVRDVGKCFWQDVDDINMATEAKSLLQRMGNDQGK